MDTTTKLATIALVVMLPASGCLGLFGGDDATEDANETSISQDLGNDTAAQIEERTSGRLKNFTIPGQEDLPTQKVWLNGSIGPSPTVASWEDRNDRSGNNYNTEYIVEDISSQLPEGQPAEIRLKLWYFPSGGGSADLDLYVNVPGTTTDFAGDDCDEFSWKVCVQEMTINTVGKSDQPAEVGVQVSNNRALQGMDYFLKTDISYAANVVAPSTPYAFQMPENATGLVITSEKAGGSEHVRGDLLVIGPDDQLVEYVTYNDIAISTESKLIPIDEPGEYIVYPVELSGGFLGVEADVPVPRDIRQGRQLATTTESVTDASAGPGSAGAGCIPYSTVDGCRNQTMNEGGSSSFSVEGTFPLEIRSWINEDGGQNANLDAEVRILNPDGGLVHLAKKFVQYEDSQGTLGLSRDTLNYVSQWENLAKGEYTVRYVIDGTATVGHTVKTYER